MTIPADIAAAIARLDSADRDQQGAAFQQVQAATALPVPWGAAVWPLVVPLLGHKDNRVRAIAGQTMCGLAISVPTSVVMGDLDAIFDVTRDERFVTARHVLLATWKIGRVPGLLMEVTDRLARRYDTCVSEKNATLIRYDVMCALRHLFDATLAGQVRDLTMQMIPNEADPKYRKKYQSVWRGA